MATPHIYDSGNGGQTDARQTCCDDDLYECVTALQIRVEELESEKANISQEWRKKVQAYVKENQALKDEVNKVTADYDSVFTMWQDSVRELEDLGSSTKTLAVDDDMMASKWNHLQFVIKNLSSTHPYHDDAHYRFTSEEKGNFRRLVSLMGNSMRQSAPHYLTEVKIWMFITSHILKPPTLIWGQDFSDSAGEFYAHLGRKQICLFYTIGLTNIQGREGEDKVPESDFMTIQAEVGALVHKYKGVDQPYCLKLKDSLKAQVQAFVGSEDDHILGAQLEAIIDKAIDIATIFNQSRSLYLVSPSIGATRRQPYNDGNMQEVDSTGGADGDASDWYIGAVLSPGLRKFGNSRGENYDEGIVLAKARVITVPSEEQRIGTGQ
ncbi:hypothetical protein GGS20DRAFT_594367 [Poronia punctata]|nr:hypothetical protein GGS20DRAFT_594367 [Poronia punctata]